jgi:hypothetical protein
VRLFRKVVARAAGRPGGVPSAARVDAHVVERTLVSVRAELLAPDRGRISASSLWRARAGALAGQGLRHGSAATHVGGTDGSAARSVPRDLPGPVTVALTDRRLVLSAEPAPGAPPVEIAAFERADVRWVARTGRRDAAGVHVRCSLADESFFDIAVAHTQAAALLAATTDLAS